MKFDIRQFTPLLMILCLSTPAMALAGSEENPTRAHGFSSIEVESAAQESSSSTLPARDEEGGEAECKWLGC